MGRIFTTVFLWAFLVCYSIAAQQSRKNGNVPITPKELVEQAHISFMAELKFDCTNFKGGSMLRGNGMPQFFVSPITLSKFTKEREFLKVYNSLNKNRNIEVRKVDFKINPAKVDSIGVGQLNSDNVVIRANKYIRYITETDLHLRIEDTLNKIVSDTCFAVVFTWQYNVGGKRVDGITHIEAIPQRYTATEKIKIEEKNREQQRMEENAKKRIMNWYADFPDKTKHYESYIGDSVVMPEVSLNNIRLSTKNDVYVTETTPKIVMISTDKDGRNFTYTITPYFEVDKGGDFRIIDVHWTPGDTIMIEKSEKDQGEKKSLKQKLAVVAAKNFSTELIACAQHPTPASRKLVASMFLDAKVNIVEVSYISVSTKERITRRIANDYLERLRESTIKINIDFEQVHYSEDGNLVVFPFEQVYRSDVYRDKVTKKLYMRAIGDAWYVEKVEVVRNSTRLE